MLHEQGSRRAAIMC